MAISNLTQKIEFPWGKKVLNTIKDTDGNKKWNLTGTEVGYLIESKKKVQAKEFWKQALLMLSGIERRGLHLSAKDCQILEFLRTKIGEESSQES